MPTELRSVRVLSQRMFQAFHPGISECPAFIPEDIPGFPWKMRFLLSQNSRVSMSYPKGYSTVFILEFQCPSLIPKDIPGFSWKMKFLLSQNSRVSMSYPRGYFMENEIPFIPGNISRFPEEQSHSLVFFLENSNPNPYLTSWICSVSKNREMFKVWAIKSMDFFYFSGIVKVGKDLIFKSKMPHPLNFGNTSRDGNSMISLGTIPRFPNPFHEGIFPEIPAQLCLAQLKAVSQHPAE